MRNQKVTRERISPYIGEGPKRETESGENLDVLTVDSIINIFNRSGGMRIEVRLNID